MHSGEGSWLALWNPRKQACNGASDCNGKLVWADGSGDAFAYAYDFEALIDEPGDKPCVYLRPGNKLGDRDCSNTLTFVCQYDCAQGKQLWLLGS